MGSSKDTQRQLALLGPLKDRVDYVDCEQRPKSCEQAQIAAVPTWLIRGKRFVGYKELDDLEVLCHKEIKKQRVKSIQYIFDVCLKQEWKESL